MRPSEKPSRVGKPGTSAARARRFGERARRPDISSAWSKCAWTVTRMRSGSKSNRWVRALAIRADALAFTAQCRWARPVQSRLNSVTLKGDLTRRRSTSSGSAFHACEQRLRACEVRAVIHLAINADGTRAGLCRECRHHRFRLFDLRGGWRKHLVDHWNLRRMNGKPSREAITACGFGIAAQAIRIAEIDVDCLDGRHFRRRRSVKTH